MKQVTNNERTQQNNPPSNPLLADPFLEANWPPAMDEITEWRRQTMSEKGWVPVKDQPGCYVPSTRTNFQVTHEQMPTDLLQDYLQILNKDPDRDEKLVKEIADILKSRLP